MFGFKWKIKKWKAGMIGHHYSCDLYKMEVRYDTRLVSKPHIVKALSINSRPTLYIRGRSAASRRADSHCIRGSVGCSMCVWPRRCPYWDLNLGCSTPSSIIDFIYFMTLSTAHTNNIK
jgi:hypothetical protein